MDKDQIKLLEDLDNYILELSGVYGVELAQNIERALDALINNQSIVSWLVDGAVPQSTDKPNKDATRTYFLALIVELTELLQELDWKAWKDKKDVDKTKIAQEFADVLAFLGVILLQIRALGVSTEDLATAYKVKSQINIERFLGKFGKEYQQVSKADHVQLSLFSDNGGKQ